MEIIKNPSAEVMLLVLRGRLDANWAPHLERQIEEVIQDGFYHIRLDMTGVDYISSAGIGALVKSYQQLQQVNGALAICALSPKVHKVLEMVGLYELVGDRQPVTGEIRSAATKHWHQHGAEFELVFEDASTPLKRRAFGDPSWSAVASAAAKDAQTLDFPPSVIGLGLGAIGDGWSQCRERLGEFMAVSGAVVYQPTDGSTTPDYLLASGALVPRLTAVYGMLCSGAFSRQIRFAASESGTVCLSDICCTAAEKLDVAHFAMVMVAESRGLVGVSLRQSPVQSADGADPFIYPKIKKWFSFTPEPVYNRHLTLTVGIFSTTDDDDLKSFLRPLSPTVPLYGHVHACAFPYRPLRKGKLDLNTTVAELFTGGAPLALLHLLHDDRPIVGVGQSEFVRGVCWMGQM